MRYVIDACNLIYAHAPLEETLERRGFQPARAMLVKQLARFAHAEKLDEIVAVFDGSEKGAHRPRKQSEAAGKVTLIYADPRANADQYIVELVEDAKRPGEITVVTNDKFIVRHVQKASGHTMSCRAFIRRMQSSSEHAADPLHGEDPRKFHGLSPREVEEWAKIMGIEDES